MDIYEERKEGFLVTSRESIMYDMKNGDWSRETRDLWETGSLVISKHDMMMGNTPVRNCHVIFYPIGNVRKWRVVGRDYFHSKYEISNLFQEDDLLDS